MTENADAMSDEEFEQALDATVIRAATGIQDRAVDRWLDELEAVVEKVRTILDREPSHHSGES